MSCNIDIDLKLNIHDAALIRQYLFQHTKQDSYEFPGQQTIVIRDFIRNLDEQIEAELSKEEKKDEEHEIVPTMPPSHPKIIPRPSKFRPIFFNFFAFFDFV